MGFLLRAGKGLRKHVPLDWIGLDWEYAQRRFDTSEPGTKEIPYLLEEMSYLLVLRANMEYLYEQHRLCKGGKALS